MGDTISAIIFLSVLAILYASVNLPPKEKKRNSSTGGEPPSLGKAFEEITEQRKRETEAKEREERQKALDELAAKNKKLDARIQKEIDKCGSENIKFLLKSLQSEVVVDEFSYSEKEWLFNDGNLRDLGELEQHKHDLKKMHYHEHPEDFDKECRQTNAAYFLIPFIFVFILCMGTCSEETGGIDDPVSWILIGPIALFLALGAAIIGMGAGHKKNLNKAEKYDIHNARTAYERKELNTLIVGGAASGLHLMHHAKKNLKEISNPDGWKEMK